MLFNVDFNLITLLDIHFYVDRAVERRHACSV